MSQQEKTVVSTVIVRQRLTPLPSVEFNLHDKCARSAEWISMLSTRLAQIKVTKVIVRFDLSLL